MVRCIILWLLAMLFLLRLLFLLCFLPFLLLVLPLRLAVGLHGPAYLILARPAYIAHNYIYSICVYIVYIYIYNI